MSEKVNPLAGKPAPLSILVNVPRLITAYYKEIPDPANVRDKKIHKWLTSRAIRGEHGSVTRSIQRTLAAQRKTHK